VTNADQAAANAAAAQWQLGDAERTEIDAIVESEAAAG